MNALVKVLGKKPLEKSKVLATSKHFNVSAIKGGLVLYTNVKKGGPYLILTKKEMEDIYWMFDYLLTGQNNRPDHIARIMEED